MVKKKSKKTSSSRPDPAHSLCKLELVNLHAAQLLSYADPFMEVKAIVVFSVNNVRNPKLNVVIYFSDRIFVGKY